MNIDKVCKYCRYFNDGECTADIVELTYSEGYDWAPGSELNHAVDMGEILEVIESVVEDQQLRETLDDLIGTKLNNLADEMESPKISIKNPESFGCNLWR